MAKLGQIGSEVADRILVSNCPLHRRAGGLGYRRGMDLGGPLLDKTRCTSVRAALRERCYRLCSIANFRARAGNKASLKWPAWERLHHWWRKSQSASSVRSARFGA